MTNTDRAIWAIFILVVIGLTLAAAAALAQTPDDVDIPIDTILRGELGDTFLVASVTASPGLKCDAFLDGRNNESVHPNTDVLIQSGANFAAILNVESAAFSTGSTSFTTDGLIEVFIRLGADGVSSTGFILELTCNPPTTTTTSTVVSSTTTSSIPVTSTTVPPVTTTTEPPPVNRVDTGGGACADGACDGSLSPLATWLTMLAVFALATGAAWAFMRAWTGPGDDG